MGARTPKRQGRPQPWRIERMHEGGWLNIVNRWTFNVSGPCSEEMS